MLSNQGNQAKTRENQETRKPENLCPVFWKPTQREEVWKPRKPKKLMILFILIEIMYVFTVFKL